LCWGFVSHEKSFLKIGNELTFCSVFTDSANDDDPKSLSNLETKLMLDNKLILVLATWSILLAKVTDSWNLVSRKPRCLIHVKGSL